jgi:Ca-activated chloride channel family protein
MTRLSIPLVAALAAIVVFTAAARMAAQEPVFRSRSDVVVLYVNVFDGKSDAVPHLPKDAFQVYEDGVPQPITFFDDTDVPVAVGLVIDNSSSMLTQRRMVLAGGTAFAESSHPDDEAFAIVFNEHVREGLPDSLQFTQSHSLLRAALLKFPPGGKTAMYDAVIAGLDHLQMADLQKRVLIVLSDADDNASSHSRQDMLHRASRSDALIYTVFSGAVSATGGDPGVMRRLAHMTGGTEYEPKTEMQTVEDFRQIAVNVRRGYRIGYVPKTSNDGSYHRVKVTVHAPGFKQLNVRVRDGYTAGESDDAQ